jgi:hypothetical protein
MITGKEFVLNRLANDKEKSIQHFEENGWRQLDHSDKNLWQQALARFAKLHSEVIEAINRQQDGLLSQKVRERNYDFRKLLYRIVQHHIYHIGQMAS